MAGARSRAAAPSSPARPLQHYQERRDFSKTPEPRGEPRKQRGTALAFVIQKHHATRLHYDFRLELDGVMLSWAVPKGPSYDPAVKRMAVRTEDHPVSYNSFEGTIPEGQYGAGTVLVWDRGTWEPVGDPRAGLAAGKLAFALHGEKMQGLWELVRMGKPGRERQDAWLLFKKHDRFERPQSDYDVVSARPDSALHPPPAPARPAALPGKLAPQLATLAASVPSQGEWIYEVKFDGYRLMARIAEGRPVLFTRGGHDWSARMPGLVAQLAMLGLQSAWLDGEIVVMGKEGVPRFNALQKAFDSHRTGAIQYFLFDAPFLDGQDLRQEPLRERRARLKAVLDGAQGTDALRFSAGFEGDLSTVLQSACSLKLEGVIAKRADAPYESRRTDTWLKLKCRQRQEFVVGGFVDRKGSAGAEIGSLLLGVHDAQGRLVPVGGVGTGGYDDMDALRTRLRKLEIEDSPFEADEPGTPGLKGRWTRGPAAAVHWVQPTLVAEVGFAEWTPDHQIRHATFEGLRSDKPARAVVREEPVSPAAAPPAPAALKPRTGARTMPQVTHPERVIDPGTGLTKLDLVRYYESVAPWIVPHLKGRPCGLLRGPAGLEGPLFFQRHLDKLHIQGAKELDPSLWPGHAPLLDIPSAQAVVAAAQMNVMEFHTWNARAGTIEKPDRLVFDLDPGEGLAWQQVLEGAELTRALLQQLELECWLKTSGGKGLHVVVPLAARHTWATALAFSKAVVEHLARVIPDRFVAKPGPANRVGRIFVDYLRNHRGATTVAAYSARARPGLGVSMPVAWDDLHGLASGAHWTIADARDHLSFRKVDPWEGYPACKQTLARALRKLGVAAVQSPAQV
jgi:bifunctional non-homologous end joining protein LigD